MQTDHLISARQLDLVKAKKKTKKKNRKKKKKGTCRIGKFADPADRRVKLKEN